MLQRVLIIVILTEVSHYLLIVATIKYNFLVCKLVLYIPEQLNWGVPFLHCWSIFLLCMLNVMTCLKLPTTLCLPRARRHILGMCFLTETWNASVLKRGAGESSHLNSFNCSCVEVATWKIIIGKVNIASCRSMECPEVKNGWSAGWGKQV